MGAKFDAFGTVHQDIDLLVKILKISEILLQDVKNFIFSVIKLILVLIATLCYKFEVCSPTSSGDMSLNSCNRLYTDQIFYTMAAAGSTVHQITY